MPQPIDNKILFMEENEIDKFYFYSSYAKPICKLSHNEAARRGTLHFYQGARQVL